MIGQRLSVALLGVGVIALGGTQHLGSPWPGVVLAALSLAPWGVGAVLARVQGAEGQAIATMGALLDKHAGALLEMQKRLEEAEGQIRSINNRKAFGG